MVNPLQQRTTQGYDPAGQQTLRIDARGFRTTYVYDPVGQRTQRKYPDGTCTTWVYDPVGNPLTIAAPAGTFTRTYDPLDQVRQLQWPTGEILTWTYDANGRRSTRETGQGIVTYAYDANSQLIRLVNEHEEVTTFSYNAANQEILKELDNGTRSTIVYDAAGQILSVANLQENDDVISRFTYLYDPTGNRTQERREDGDLRVFSYDPTNQLISEERQDSIGTSRTTYVYDPVGNRLVLNVDGELTTSVYDAANRLQTAEEINGVTTYMFDANGNQRSVETPTGEITTYSWSFENQLIQIEAPDDLVTTQIYAPVNRKADELRIAKETDIGTVNFIWDDQNIIREVDETNTIEAEYTLNPQPYGNLVSQRRENESTFYNYDALGSTESLTDQSGTVENEYTYSAFGKILNQTGSVENPFTWVGELGYYQNPDGSYTLRRRDYTAEESRFRSEDPIQADENNLYRYAGNSPLTVVDPSGEEGQPATCSAPGCASCPTSKEASLPYAYYDLGTKKLTSGQELKCDGLFISREEFASWAEKETAPVSAPAYAPGYVVPSPMFNWQALYDNFNGLCITLSPASGSLSPLIPSISPAPSNRDSCPVPTDAPWCTEARAKHASLDEKLQIILNRSPQYLDDALAEQIRALLSPANIAIFTAIAGTLGACHFSPGAPACLGVDAVLAAALSIALGTESIAISGMLYELIQDLNRATTCSELDAAAKSLAAVFARMGTDASLLLGVKKAGKTIAKGTAPSNKPVHIDIGGEGRYPDAKNVNPGMFGNEPVTSGPTQSGGAGAAGRPIPNLVKASGENLPFANQSVDIVTLQNAPITTKTVSEIARVIKPGGDIRLVGPNTPEVLAAHKYVADAVGGKIYQVVVKNSVFTNIVVPCR